MFLHIGSDVVIPKSEIVIIFNLHNNNSYICNKSLSKIIVSEKISKSCIVTNSIVYFSPISTVTLQKRIKQYL